MKYPRYQNYRPSGVEWIGEVPTTWNLLPLKYVARFVNGAPFKPEDWGDEGVPIIRIQNLNGSLDFNRTTRAVAPSYHVREGDLLFSWSGNPGTSFGPFRWGQPGLHYLNQHIFSLRDLAFEKPFLYWALRAATDYIESTWAHGIIGMVHVKQGDLGRISVPLVTPEDQRCIADFLDAKTAEIDALIAKEEGLVRLLEEKRAALITHTVTKGLDPKAPMKESGSPWVGRMPEHWRYARVAYVADVFNGSTPDRDNPDYWEQGDVPWLSSGKVNDGTVIEADEFVTQKALRECSIRRMPPGSVLVGMIGQGKTRGMSAFMEMSACINQNVAAVVPRAGTNGRFLHFVFKAAYLPLREFGRGGQQDALNCDLIKAFRVPIPPEDEQERIARYLGEKTAWVDELSSKVRLAIDRLREYRTALISAAVTGKIDVRNLTPTTPCQ